MKRPMPKKGITAAAPTIPFRRVATMTPTIRWTFLDTNQKAAAYIAICTAIYRCMGTPRGNPTVAAVKTWPKAATIPPSRGPKATAEKKPGLESRATVPMGLGIFINAPTALRAIKMAMRAILAGRHRPLKVTSSAISSLGLSSWDFLSVSTILLTSLLF